MLCLVFCLLLLLPACLIPAEAADAYSYPEPEVLQIDIVMQPYRYLSMIRSTEKKKHDAVVYINGDTPQNIGVQIRGASSLRQGMRSKAKRIPMELCFDYADPDGAFRGNPSLKLINCTTPARLLTQLIAIQAFAFLDIPTPSVTPAFIRINDTDFGLYLAVEDLNEAFVRNHFGDVTLYRAAIDRDVDRTFYTFESHSIVAKVDRGCETLAQYNEAKKQHKDAERFLDVDEFLRFMACETFLMSHDGFCHSMNNFYLADDHGKLQLLPWDLDYVFTAFNLQNGFHDFETESTPLFQELMQNAAYYAKYRQYIRKLNDEFLNPDTFLPWLESYIRYLVPYLQRDPTIAKLTDDVFAELTTGNALYNTMTGNLLLTFQIYHDQASAQLSGKTDSFSAPKGMTVSSYDLDEIQSHTKAGKAIIFQICANYWKMRRHAFWQSDSKGALAAAGIFILVFVCIVWSVYRPRHRLQKSRQRSDSE